MGTAPHERQHPALPDPLRLVRKSLWMLKQLGMTDEQALELIAEVGRTARFRLHGTGQWSATWLSLIVNDAEDRLAVLAPSIDETEGSEHGDGTGGRAGRTTAGQQETGRPQEPWDGLSIGEYRIRP